MFTNKFVDVTDTKSVSPCTVKADAIVVVLPVGSTVRDPSDATVNAAYEPALYARRNCSVLLTTCSATTGADVPIPTDPVAVTVKSGELEAFCISNKLAV